MADSNELQFASVNGHPIVAQQDFHAATRREFTRDGAVAPTS
jgi:hypothetical protein